MRAFFVPGIPVTQGSTRAFVRGGRAVVTHDKREPLLNWRNAIAFAAREAARGEFYAKEDAVEVYATFLLPRPKSAPRRVTQPVKKPDLDKLARGLLDALTGVVFADDSQVVGMRVDKVFGDQTGVQVLVVPCDD